MSGRFVRASKYRHVHGEPNRKDRCYTGVKPGNPNDGNVIKGNASFVGYCTTGGGGPVVILHRNDFTRLGPSPPNVNVHSMAVLDLDFSPFMDNLVATASEDMHVKVTMFPETGVTQQVDQASADLEGHGKKVILVRWHPTASNVLGSISSDNTFRVWDVEKQAEKGKFDFADSPQWFEWNHDGSLAGVTSKDKKLLIFDPRQSGSAQQVNTFAGSKSSRFVFCDNHNMIVGFGFGATSERCYSVWDSRNISSPVSSEEIDQSAGVIMPFYDADSSVIFAAGKGDGNIRYYELTSEAPHLFFLSEFRSNEPQKGCAMLPKRACDTTVCEIAPFLRLMNDYIQPVSFQVPRKAETFQEDLFPDAYAGVPVLTADEWFSGQNKPPTVTSMNPSNKSQTAKSASVFKASKPAHVLEKELAEALHRIKELEEEVARLKHH